MSTHEELLAAVATAIDNHMDCDTYNPFYSGDGGCIDSDAARAAIAAIVERLPVRPTDIDSAWDSGYVAALREVRALLTGDGK